MTTALGNAAAEMAPLPLSLTTYGAAYYQWFGSASWTGPFDLPALAATDMSQLNIELYTSDASTFSSGVSFMYSNIGSSYSSKVQIAMGDASNWNSPIAGYCLNLTLSDGTQSVAVWPNGGGLISNGGNSYSDTYYSTSNWAYGTNSWFYYYSSHVT